MKGRPPSLDRRDPGETVALGWLHLDSVAVSHPSLELQAWGGEALRAPPPRQFGPIAEGLVYDRGFLPGEEGAWIDERRRELEEIRVRALECTARRSLGIGGSEISVAEHTARRLVDVSPYRESGYALLMEALEREGNIAEALRVYERLRGVLREELGAAPSALVRRVHERLLSHGSVC